MLDDGAASDPKNDIVPALTDKTANNLKRICFDNLAYAQCKELARTLIHKVVYSQNKLIIYIDTTADVKNFTSDTFNQNANPMDFVVDGDFMIINIPIMLNRYTSKIKPGTLTVTDNNHLILKTFAIAWKYCEMYEQCGDMDTIARMVGSTPRTIYRFLDIAYMNPIKVNEILSGKTQVNVNELFKLAKSNQAPACYNR